ncbi:ribosomal protein L19 [Kwoniella sp. CBS 9459]
MSRHTATGLFGQAAQLFRPAASSAASSSRGFASSSSASSSYPFNPSAITGSSSAASPAPQSLLAPRRGWSVITHLTSHAPKSQYADLFSRRHPDRIKTGSVITVQQYTDATRKSVSPFSGVLMGIKRGGVDTSFRLRNIVNKTGVEMSFKINSPLIKEIKVVKRAEGRTGAVRDLRRSKVNYLRERPSLMTSIAGAIKASKRA